MTLQPGRRLGPYEILAALGAGGMGEVYKARDTRLDRIVAIKVLPEDLSQRPDRRERFEREARAVSAFSHPHICTLHDIGRQDGVDFLVMEHLEGETLAERLARGALPLGQALRCAIEVASALDAAHRHGVTHRDLKPGNVMLTKSGTKLLDFGLAKLRETGSGPGETRSPSGSPGGGGGTAALSGMPTRNQPLTAEGTLLGTLQYMAPEQLEGQEADARTDIFAFGVVLYEMVTGRKAFEGKSQASLIAAIIGREPAPVSALQPLTPPALERLVKRCLAKDPDDRWQSARDLGAELQWIAGSSPEGGAGIAAASGAGAGTPAASRARPLWRERLAWGVAVLALVALAAALAWLTPLLQSPEVPTGPVVVSVLLPEKVTLDSNAGPVAISPDGRRLAFVARTAEDKNYIWVRPMDRPMATLLAGTEGAVCPFWSPDSRFIGFFAEGKLKKIDASGGPAETLCSTLVPVVGGTWSRQGQILFAAGYSQPVLSVPAAGGTPAPVTAIDTGRGVTGHSWPSFLPDGLHFLYLAGTGTSAQMNAVYLASLDNQDPKPLLPSPSNALYAPPGRLLTWRDGALRAQQFDPATSKVTGEGVVLASDVPFNPGLSSGLFSVSETGVLAYPAAAGSGLHRLLWLDRVGKPIGSVGAPGNYYSPRLSHDGRRVAVDMSDQQNNGDIWIHELTRSVASRFTFDPANESAPIWSPVDDRIAFFSNKGGGQELYQKIATGTATEEPLLGSSVGLELPTDWSADGRVLAFDLRQPDGGSDIWVLSIPDQKATPFLAAPFHEAGGNFSPDGKWMVYISDESGRDEVYVQPYPGPGGKWQVSTDGGTWPAWRRDGREIYYVAPGDRLMAAEVTTSPRFETGTPKLLFQAHFKVVSNIRQYDVSSDGRRFLVNTPVEGEGATSITLILNWAAALEPK